MMLKLIAIGFAVIAVVVIVLRSVYRSRMARNVAPATKFGDTPKSSVARDEFMAGIAKMRETGITDEEADAKFKRDIELER